MRKSSAPSLFFSDAVDGRATPEAPGAPWAAAGRTNGLRWRRQLPPAALHSRRRRDEDERLTQHICCGVGDTLPSARLSGGEFAGCKILGRPSASQRLLRWRHPSAHHRRCCIEYLCACWSVLQRVEQPPAGRVCGPCWMVCKFDRCDSSLPRATHGLGDRVRGS